MGGTGPDHDGRRDERVRPEGVLPQPATASPPRNGGEFDAQFFRLVETGLRLAFVQRRESNMQTTRTTGYPPPPPPARMHASLVPLPIVTAPFVIATEPPIST